MGLINAILKAAQKTVLGSNDSAPLVQNLTKIGYTMTLANAILTSAQKSAGATTPLLLDFVTPLSGSPLTGAGYLNGTVPAYDFVGGRRPTIPTIGALEGEI